MSNNKERTYFPFYWNWAELINDSYDDDDKEFACLLAFAIVRYASTGEIIDLGDKRAQRMFEKALAAGVDSAEKHYEDGKKGGRPNKLSDVDNELIAEMRANRKTAKDIAKHFAVSDDTILRSDGWKHYQDYLNDTQNLTAKPQNLNRKTQNQEEEEEEKEEEKEKKEEETISFGLDWSMKTQEEKNKALGF